ncbi:hypothetical protein [uncultured Roseobacter sp.]|uniref:hypothetical protein n=1 Tax=uncultured Roseobacter sp. TaxID=114847 RepID=UPI0026320786|nr:hypothetical protein [uncultured Roseobacter sp.]
MQDAQRFHKDFALIFFVLFAIYVLRDVPGALAPPLFNEDGPNMLDFYTASHAPADIFRFYGGYVSVGPNLLGYLFGFLPIAAAVYALYWVPIAIAALTFAVMCHPSFALPGMTRPERMFIALLLGLFPAANTALMTNTTFALWNLAILLFFLGLLWTPRTGVGAVAGAVFCVIAATSHPVSVILFPVLLWRVWQAQTALERWAFLPVTAVLPVYLLIGVAPDGSGDTPAIIATLWEAIRLFLERGIFETLFSTRVRSMFLHRDLAVGLWIISLGLLGVVIWQARGRVRLLVVVLLTLGFGNSLFCAVAREMPLENTWGHRYGYLTGVLFLLAAALSLLPAWRRWSPGLRWLRPAAITALTGLILLSLALKLPYYRTNPVKRMEVAQLLDTLQDATSPYCLRVDRGEWSFAVRDSENAECVTLPAVTR